MLKEPGVLSLDCTLIIIIYLILLYPTSELNENTYDKTLTIFLYKRNELIDEQYYYDIAT